MPSIISITGEQIKDSRNELSTGPGEVESYGHTVILLPAGTEVMALVLASSAFLLAKQLSFTNAHRFVFSYQILPIGIFSLTPPNPVATNTDALGIIFICSKTCLS